MLTDPTVVTHFEENDPEQKSPKGVTMSIAASTTSTVSRTDMVAAIKLRDPSFVDSTSYSDAYISGRYSGALAMQPVVGVPKRNDPAQPVVKTDNKDDLSPVTKAQIEYDAARDRARGIASRPAVTKRTDATETLSPVTVAQIESDRRNYPNGAA